ncbi:hypothetical protein ACFVYE_15335 [Streptomyces sp. NPDC058239]|uniref:hypothetical protein n=1 Tax=unclassified Streptomyces TaxID=2593676 RepID=UPI003661A671
MRRRQSSARICVERANTEHKRWRPLQRFLGRREHCHRAVATRYDELAVRYEAAVLVAPINEWL